MLPCMHARCCCLAIALLLPAGGAAQAHGHGDHQTPRHDSISAMATALLTHVTPALAGRARTEALLTQPMLMARGSHAAGALQYAVMLNAERWTMPGGEPVAAIWGEGFIDRRHPHTVLHEVMLTGVRRIGGWRASLSAGKGIVPFGTDDPMVRPFTKYPANHHFSQVLERVQVVTSLRPSPRVGLELAAFNGDEPTGPLSMPQWSRLGDSRAGRLTVWPRPQLELQGSAAFVRSPEFPDGAGLDQQKASASARWTPAGAGPLRYLLVEWARTEERYRARSIVAYGTGLAEAGGTRGRWEAALRFEQTSRPEEERLLDPFRTSRPPTDLTVRGVTHWRLATLHAGTSLMVRNGLHGTLFAEGTRAQSRPVLRPVLLDPAAVIGAAKAWHLTVGLRLGAGAMPARVGRYGAASGATGGAVSGMHGR